MGVNAMTTCLPEVLDKVVKERVAAVLSLPGDPTRQWPIRFLAVESDQGLWVQVTDERCGSLNPFVAAETELQVHIHLERQRYTFRTPALRRNKHYWLNESVMLDALLLQMPAEVTTDDRRARARLLVPDSSSAFAQIICPSSPAIQVKPWDISASGASFLCSYNPVLAAIKPGQQVGFVINYHSRKFSGSGTVCMTRPLTGRVTKMGIQFVEDSLDATAKQALEFLLGELSRLDVLTDRVARAKR